MGEIGSLRRIRAAVRAGFVASAAAATPSAAQTVSETGVSQLPAAAGVVVVLAVMGVLIWTIMTSRRLEGSSLFNRLFIVVAVAAGFFSAVSSAIGFSLITSQESEDFFRNAVLPPAFGVFVFFLAVAIWVGGAELVRHRDWFRHLGSGLVGDMAFFIERAVKLLVLIPILAVILFFVSTWTTVVGIGGVDAVRHTYNYEIDRLATECAGITAYRQRDFLFLEDLRLSVADVTRVAESERQGGAQSGAAGGGAVTDYFVGLTEWYRGLEMSVIAIIEGPDPSGVNPYDPEFCGRRTEDLRRLLSRNAFENYDRWAREFETVFNDFAITLNRWRQDRRIENLLDQQRANFERANPKPVGARITTSQREAIDRYATQVDDALRDIIRRQRLAKPPIPTKSAAELAPAQGLQIFLEWISPPAPPPEEEDSPSRTQAVVVAEVVPGLSTITPRDAVLKHANIFSDIWALAISWDYAPYILMFAFLFFPSAERAAGRKD
jgi:hypothetical protein